MAKKKELRGLGWRINVPSSFKRGLVHVLILALVLGLVFELLPRGVNGDILYPKPSRILRFYWEYAGELMQATIATASRITIALVLGSAIGFTLGIGLSMFRVIETEHLQIVSALKSIPRTAIVLYVTIAFGNNPMTLTCSLILFVTLSTWFYSAEVMHAMWEDNYRSRDVHDMLPIEYRTRFDLFWNRVLKETRDSRFIALQESVTFIWPSVIFAEGRLLPQGPGLGTLVYESTNSFQVYVLVGGAIMIVVLANIFRLALQLIKKSGLL